MVVDGTFLQIEPEEALPPLPLSSEESDNDLPEESDKVQLLKQALYDAKHSRDKLQADVAALTVQVEQLSKRCKELSQADYDGLLSYLLQCDFTSVYNCSDIESTYLEFSTVIYQAIDQFVPTVKFRRHQSPKWFTPEIHHLKNRL